MCSAGKIQNKSSCEEISQTTNYHVNCQIVATYERSVYEEFKAFSKKQNEPKIDKMLEEEQASSMDKAISFKTRFQEN